MAKKLIVSFSSIFSLIFLVCVSHSHDNIVLQGTVDEISEKIVTDLKAKEFAKAEEILKNLFNSRINGPNGKRKLEEVYSKLKKFEDEEILDQWCKSSLKSHFSLVVRGNYYIKMAENLRGASYARQISEESWKKIKELQVKAQVDYEAAFEMNPDDAAIAAAMIGICLQRSYPIDAMESWFQKSIKADPNWIGAYRAKLYYLAPWWHGNKKQLDSFVKECYQNSPEGTVVYTIPLLHLSMFYNLEFFLGDSMTNGYGMQSEQVAMINDALERFHKDCPDSPEPDYYQGLLYHTGGSYEDAILHFKKAETKDPKFLNAWIGEAFTELILERTDKAEIALNEILKIDPNSMFALMNLGYVKMLKSNDYDGGLEIFFKGLKVSNNVPRKVDGLYRLGQFLIKRGKYQESIKCFTEAIALDPVNTSPYFGRANAKTEMGDFDGAMEDMLTVKEMGGKDAESAEAVAENILNEKMKKDAQIRSEQAVQPYPDSVVGPPNSDTQLSNSTLTSEDVKTADIRNTIDDSPTAVVDNRDLLERFNACEALYFRRLKDQAIDCFSSILLEAPEYPKTYFMLGQIAEKLEADLKKATNYYTKAISKDQSNMDYMLRLAQVLYMDRNFPQSIQVLTKSIEQSPTNGEAFYQRGLCFDALGEKEQAIEDMQKASMYAAKTEAAEYLSRNVVIEAPPPLKIDREQELILQIDQNLNMQRFDQAEKQIHEVLSLNPNNDYAIFKLGAVYGMRDRDLKKALVEYGKAIKINPKNKDYYLARASVYQHQEEYQNAADDYTSALELDPKEGKYYGERGHCWMKLGEYQKAIEDLNTSSELSPGNKKWNDRLIAEISVKAGIPFDEGSMSPTMLVERGKRFAEQKDFDLAKKDIQQAITQDPKFANAYYEMGRVYAEKMRLLDEAIPWFDKAIGIEKNRRDYYFHRGLIFFEKRDFQKAKPDFTSALELQKDDTQSYYYRGVCNKELGLKDQAVEDLLKAREDPSWVQGVDGLLQSMM